MFGKWAVERSPELPETLEMNEIEVRLVIFVVDGSIVFRSRPDRMTW